jgi:nucleoid-associated protein YgaU
VSQETNRPAAGNATADAQRTTASGATKVFREFKWGLLTLFLLMVVVIALVYDGGRKKDPAQRPAAPPTDRARADAPPEAGSDLAAIQKQEGQPPGFGALSGAPIQGAGTPIAGPAGQVPSPGQFVPPDRIMRLPEIPGEPPPYLRPVDRTASGVALEPVGAGPRTETARPAGPPAAGTSYRVQAGDTLEKIARQFFPGRVQTGIRSLAEANHITDPRLLREGVTLKVPELAPLDSRTQATPPSEGAPAGQRPSQIADPTQPARVPRTGAPADEQGVYLVQSGDTLERIARRVLNDGRRWRELYEWNRDQLSDPALLRVGQRLRTRAPGGESPATQEGAQPGTRPARKDSKIALEGEPASQRPAQVDTSAPAPRWMP